MPSPHDNWANYYDFVYERTFGQLYSSFTQTTINVIHELQQGGTVLDFGAGTGRMSIPLAQSGYKVIAIDMSIPMAEVLRQKAIELNLTIETHNCSIQKYNNGKADLALCLFTVLSYAITEIELKKIIKNIAKHLNFNGYFFFDLPTSAFFQHTRLINHNSNGLNRIVDIFPENQPDVYKYQEDCCGSINGLDFEYTASFPIRYWNPNFVNKILQDEGFVKTHKDLSQFNNTGATYMIYQKK